MNGDSQDSRNTRSFACGRVVWHRDNHNPNTVAASSAVVLNTVFIYSAENADPPSASEVVDIGFVFCTTQFNAENTASSRPASPLLSGLLGSVTNFPDRFRFLDAFAVSCSVAVALDSDPDLAVVALPLIFCASCSVLRIIEMNCRSVKIRAAVGRGMLRRRWQNSRHDEGVLLYIISIDPLQNNVQPPTSVYDHQELAAS